MLNERLIKRCPSAKPIGIAHAPNHSVNFSKIGADKSGKATLYKHAGAQQFGVLFNINSNDLVSLDVAEGVNFGYERRDDFLVIRSNDQTKIRTTTYLALKIDTNLSPFDWYLDLVIAGAKQHGLPTAQISKFQETKFQPDNKENRKGRLEALEVLKNSNSNI